MNQMTDEQLRAFERLLAAAREAVDHVDQRGGAFAADAHFIACYRMMKLAVERYGADRRAADATFGADLYTGYER